ncbi:MAG: hypothetical protein JW717_03960 [Marinilabiliaceae bacterium]|nr:hypothetical protein [Marinilabiliaceae bacterium]
MKTKSTHNTLVAIGFLLLSFVTISCNEKWDNYYSLNDQQSDDVEIYSGDIENYIKSKTNLSVISAIFNQNSIFDSIQPNGGYTIIVYTNDIIENETVPDKASFAKNCVSNIAFNPSKLTDGLGISTLLGKNIWIKNDDDGTIFFDNYELIKQVKTTNGFVYYLNGIIPIRKSVYEMFESLNDNYSYFKSLVKRYEEVYFNKEQSTPVSIDAMGNTVYDTVMTIRNTLIDRYTEEGLKTWDMFSEDYLSTMFIPSNTLITNALETAFNNIPLWLNRPVTLADTLKFEEWIVKACFVNQRLSENMVAPTASADITCVNGCQQVIDLTQDVEKYEPIDPAYWRPSVQVVNNNNPVPLSNGVAYFVTHFKIPNHIAIYRVKAKFYELWGAMTPADKEKYFRWTNWVDPLQVNDAQTEFTLTETLPTMYYHVLTAIPSESARTDSSVCSVTYDGLLFNSSTKKLSEVHLPAGEYYLRMGFKHSLRYSIDIYFNNQLLIKDMLLSAQGSNYHFDRGSVSEMDYYGSSSIGFPEGYNWRDWIEKNEKAVAYDTDGYQVAIVNLPDDGNFTITISSKDNSYFYDPANGRSKNNVTQLMMYHWCLRPTTRNY